MTATMTGYLMGAQEQAVELYKVGLGSVRYPMAFGDLLIGRRLLEHAEIAQRALDDGADPNDRAFHAGKVSQPGRSGAPTPLGPSAPCPVG